MPEEEVLTLTNTLLERATDNALIAVLVGCLLAVLFGVYVISRVYVIMEIRSRNTAKVMSLIEAEFHIVSRDSQEKFKKIWLKRFSLNKCKKCLHPRDSFYGNVQYNLLHKTLNRIKQRWHENHLLSMSESDIKKESVDLGKKLRSQNQHGMEHFASGSLYSILNGTHDERFSENQTIDLMEKILRIMIEQKSVERSEIRRAVTLRKDKK